MVSTNALDAFASPTLTNIRHSMTPTQERAAVVADNEWTQHDGGERPIDGDAIVNVRLRTGFEYQAEARRLLWKYGSPIWENYGERIPAEYEIVSYQLVKEARAHLKDNQ